MHVCHVCVQRRRPLAESTVATYVCFEYMYWNIRFDHISIGWKECVVLIPGSLPVLTQPSY